MLKISQQQLAQFTEDRKAHAVLALKQFMHGMQDFKQLPEQQVQQYAEKIILFAWQQNLFTNAAIAELAQLENEIPCIDRLTGYQQKAVSQFGYDESLRRQKLGQLLRQQKLPVAIKLPDNIEKLRHHYGK